MRAKEQTTIRIPNELYVQVSEIAHKENETINSIVIGVAKRIVSQYRFTDKGELIVHSS